MRLAFELSGESESIPQAEVLAIFRGVVAQKIERVLVMDVEIYDQQLANRLAMTHAVIEVKEICAQKLTSIYQAAQDIELPRVSVAVRAKRIGPGLRSVDVEATIGKALAERGFEIDLAHPQLFVRALLSEDVCIIGKTLTQINRSQFESRRPRFRPYFYPGVLLPRIARAAVNLSGIKAHELIFDPFCGTGGLLLEAGLIGATALGSDVDSRMVFGTQMNLDYFGIKSALLVQDAKRLALQDECVDAVTTDLPYGRSVSIQAQSLEQLTGMAMDEIFRVLKSDACAVLISHNPIEREVLDAGFTIEGRHTQYVHKSLTREIIVVRK
ncbi:MAG: THUMP domain-containing protein [Euryarchaeota archaeon]|nr:THUMP domain-containing protein [Euryarchaeota archaeon]